MNIPENIFNNLTEGQKEAIEAARSSEELSALAKECGIELTIDQLEGVSGGGYNIPPVPKTFIVTIRRLSPSRSSDSPLIDPFYCSVIVVANKVYVRLVPVRSNVRSGTFCKLTPVQTTVKPATAS